eukprot:TRINITY_DN337_c1_g1_i1.p2 TRINITY_DN337_c1_g1~~TRINITY_DN337_c1_g1_i1.p2  ORF type:complete len:167 (+),score=15.96 TRINITY_DN337_c1_g1_i1:70-501(+)
MPVLATPTFSRGLFAICPPELFCCDILCFSTCHVGRAWDPATKGEASTGINCPICIGSICCMGGCPCVVYERMKIRERYSIEGSPVKDALTTWCCMPCVLLQNHRELSIRGLPPGHCCCSPPPTPEIQVVVTQNVQPAPQTIR